MILRETDGWVYGISWVVLGPLGARLMMSYDCDDHDFMTMMTGPTKGPIMCKCFIATNFKLWIVNIRSCLVNV